MIAKPSLFSLEELLCFKELVEAGGEIEPAGLAARILKAQFLGVSLNGEDIVSVGAIKVANEGYRRSVFEKSCTDERATDFPFELGWVYTEDAFRGRGHCRRLLTELLCSVSGNIFATARASNEDIHKIIEKFGFEQSGSPYPGRKEPVQLFVRK